MMTAHTRLPKDQHPNTIRKSYKDTYVISHQRQTFTYADKISYEININNYAKQFISLKTYLFRYINSLKKEIDIFDVFNHYNKFSVLQKFSYIKETFQYLKTLSLIQDPSFKYRDNSKIDFSKADYIIIYEERNDAGSPTIYYDQYKIEILPNNPKNSIISHPKARVFLGLLPSEINNAINWKPNPRIYI